MAYISFLVQKNLLLDKQGYLKITDFGFAKKVDARTGYRTFTLCGTPEYIAPEVLLNKGHGKGVDWWTLGILIYEMITGEPPFLPDDSGADDSMVIYRKILSSKPTFPKRFDRNAKSLVKKFLTADLTKRYGCRVNGAWDIKKAKWFDGLNWQKLIKKELSAPIIPIIKGDTDTSNFDDYEDSELEGDYLSIEDVDPMGTEAIRFKGF
jgi:serine/threonine protein kinase